jgi:alkylhydroperoxidase/carboxymuconolactone decarboxylase family protein YurZ
MPTMPEMLTVENVREAVLTMLAGAHGGESLDTVTAALIGLAVRAAPTTLDGPGTREYIDKALDVGATADQIHGTVVLVSALGVHGLYEGSRHVAEALRARGDARITGPLDAERRELLDHHAGDPGVRERMETAAPGFLEALVRLSPLAFEGYFAYRAVPWSMPGLSTLQKELISLAVDAMPSHRYLPTLRMHVANALALGAGSRAIEETLAIADSGPPHLGVW